MTDHEFRRSFVGYFGQKVLTSDASHDTFRILLHFYEHSGQARSESHNQIGGE